MTALERNGDVVKMASYAPLLANKNHTSWNPNLIYFTNTVVTPTINYYVQKLFSVNQGDTYYSNIISFADKKDSSLAASCVKDSKTGDIILKIVNAGPVNTVATADLSRFGQIDSKASLDIMSGAPEAQNTLQDPQHIIPANAVITIMKNLSYNVPAYSLSVIRIRSKK
jgi:alpha-L-arabinofuranosidase